MPLPKSLVTSAILLLTGCVAGSITTWVLCNRKHKAELIENTTSVEFVSADRVLEQIALLDKQDISGARTKLNYELAYFIYDARRHAHELGTSGWLSRMLLEKSADQIKRSEYLIEEAKVIKEISEPKYIM